ncbi:MAG: amidohydrolase [Caldiserica bacterium]|nr:amidohydrolase [Caldisericota bacterium]
MFADLVIRGARFPTAPGADALAVRGGVIQAVGGSSELQGFIGPHTRILDLNGQVVLPGFIDAHTHFVRVGLERTLYVDLSDVGSLDEALERLRAAARERRGDWVVARGWDESRWPERRPLERADLDRAVPRQPCCAIRVDGHLVVCNTPALARCPRADDELVDRKRGHLREGAAWELLDTIVPDLATLVDAIAAASRHAAELGVTAVAEMSGKPEYLRAYLHALEEGVLRTRIFLYIPQDRPGAAAALGTARDPGGELLRVVGVKAFVDGSIGARTAALTSPYRDGDTAGTILLGAEELARIWREVSHAGLQLAVHAIGDRAIAEVLRAARLAGVSGHGRHRIEHLELPTEEHLREMADLELVASMQPNFVVNWSGPGKLYERRLGPERDACIDPHALVLAHGIPLAFGSDGMPMGPLYGLPGAVSPPYEAQRIPVEEALRAYTAGAAFSLFAEDELGEIAPGKRADLVVLSDDPRAARPGDIRVEMTFLDGEVIFAR